MKKIMIREYKKINDLTGPVDYIIEILQQYKNSDWYVDTIEEEDYYEPGRSYTSTKTILTRTRLETDEEYNKRLELLETQKRIKKEEAKEKRLRKKEQERKEYERLKKKFEE